MIMSDPMCFYVLYFMSSLIPLMIDYLQVTDVERCFYISLEVVFDWMMVTSDLFSS